MLFKKRILELKHTTRYTKKEGHKKWEFCGINVTINDYAKLNDYAKEPVGVNLGWLNKSPQRQRQVQEFSRHAKLRPSTLISKPYTSGGNDYADNVSFAVTVLFCSFFFVRELSLSLVSRSVHQSWPTCPHKV